MKYSGNHSGLTAKENYGRGPAKGNDGKCHDPISGTQRVKSAPSSVPDTHAPSAPGKAAYRGQGGTKVSRPTTMDKINAGRGPTKGNQL